MTTFPSPTFQALTLLTPLNSEWVSLVAHGGVGDGTTDNTAAFNAVLATGKHVYIAPGNYLVRGQITCTTPGQIIQGDGRDCSVILVDATFNMAAAGVFASTIGEPGPDFRDFGVAFAQPDTTVRADLIAYPPAFYLQGQPRFRIRSCRISRAVVGVDMRGNAGGALIEDCEISAFSIGIDIDGSQDTVRINNVHIWPFGCTPNQQTIVIQPQTIGIHTARCDDLKLQGILFYGCGTQLQLYRSASGITSGMATCCSFDSYSGIAMSDGLFAVSGCYFSVVQDGYSFIVLTGGSLNVAGCWGTIGVATTNPLITVNAATGATASLMISSCTFMTASFDVTELEISQSAGGGESLCSISNCMFYRFANIAYTKPTILVDAGSARLIASGNRVLDKGSGAGTFIQIAADNWHSVTGNVGTGWAYSFPAASFAVYANNS